MKKDFPFLFLLVLFFWITAVLSCKKEVATNSTPGSSNDSFWLYRPYSGSVNSFAISNKGNWFLGVDKGLIVSQNQGGSFTTYNYPALSSSEVSVVRTGANGEIYELLSDGTLLRSDDNGANYVNIGNNLNSSTIQYIKFRSVDVMPGGDLWCGVFLAQSSGQGTIPSNEEALAHSTDKGQTWTFPAGLNASNSAVEKVAADTKGNLYAIVSNSSVARSADGGKTWSYIYPQSGIYVINDLVVNPKDQVLIAGDHGLALSNNQGASFQSVSLPNDLAISYLENVLSSNGGGIFITAKTTLVDHSADKSSNCYLTKDGGASWQNIANVPGVRVIWLQGFDGSGHLLGKYATSVGTGICVSAATY